MHLKHLVFAFAGSAFACHASKNARAPTPPPAIATLLDTATWLIWRTPAFSVHYPPGATIQADTDRFSGYVGQSLRWDFSGNQWLRIAFARLPKGPTAPASYVDSVRLDRNARLNPDWAIAPALPMRIGTYAGFELKPDCGDCLAFEDYLELPQARVVASFSVEQNLPYTYEQQEALYRRIVATVQP